MARLFMMPAAFGLAMLIGAPAVAGYGAVAHDADARKQGAAWNETTQERANQAALRDCGSDKCKVRFGVPRGMCAALATPDSGPAWGGAVRKSADAASSAAVKNCQAHAAAKCTVREQGCTSK